jgi:hypothetical protein
MIYGMSSFPLPFIFFKMVIAPPTRYIYIYIHYIMERKGSGNDKDDGSAGSKGAPKGKPKAKPKSASISYIFYIILVSNVYTVLFIYIFIYMYESKWWILYCHVCLLASTMTPKEALI